MATKPKPEKGEWSSKTLLEKKTSGGVIWRAQISTAPDGKKFAGLRKVAVKKDGTEIPTRDGLTFLYNAASIGDEVDLMVELLLALKGGKVKVEEKPKHQFMLVNREGKKLVDVKINGKRCMVLHTKNSTGMTRLFNSLAEAKGYREAKFLSHEEVSKDWLVKKYDGQRV